jgi:integral membrane protein (TIGR01906 family)
LDDKIYLEGGNLNKNLPISHNILKKILDISVRWLFILCLPLLLVTASFRIPANMPYMYYYLFQKYDVGITTGFDDATLQYIASGLVRYYNSNEEYINLTVTRDGQPFQVFNEREIVHLKDVKGLFRLDLWVFLGTAAFALSYVVFSVLRGQENRRRLARALVISSGLTLGLMIILGIGILLDFDELLLRFHLLSFANDFWLLDPTHDYLIMLVTGGFMYDATLIVAGATAIGAAVLGGAGTCYLLYQRHRDKSTGTI